MNLDEVRAPYVSIGRFVYRCAAHPDVLCGQIAMNAVHRRENNKFAGDSVDVIDFLVPMSNFDIKSVTLKACWLKPSPSSPSDLANKFRTEFEGHVLTKDQKLTMNYEGNIVYVTVVSEGRGLLTMNSEVGVHWEE